MKNKINICGRFVGEKFPPLVIAEIGINHEGDLNKAKKIKKHTHGARVENSTGGHTVSRTFTSSFNIRNNADLNIPDSRLVEILENN